MKLIIYNKNNYNKEFIYDYLPKLMLDLLNNSINYKHINRLDSEFKIDSAYILKFSVRNFKITEQVNSYTIEVDKNKKIKGYNLDSLINLITYGNRSCRGYLLLNKIFRFVADNLDQIYEEWLDGD